MPSTERWTPARNMEVIRDWITQWNAGDLEAAFQHWSPNVVHHARNYLCDYEELEAFFRVFLAAFECHQEIEDMFATGSKVTTRTRMRCIHKGEFMGRPPTGNELSWESIDITRLSKGKIVEHWGVFDELYMLAQLNVVPDELVAYAPLNMKTWTEEPGD